MLYCPAPNCVPSNVAVAWVMPLDVLPLVRKAVPRTVLPLLNVISPVGAEPSPVAVIVAVRSKPCADCCDRSVVVVAICEMENVLGVKFTLSIKLLSPVYPAVMECGPDAICAWDTERALPVLSTGAAAMLVEPVSQKFTFPPGAP